MEEITAFPDRSLSIREQPQPQRRRLRRRRFTVERRSTRVQKCMILLSILLLFGLVTTTSAWEWTDFLGGSLSSSIDNNQFPSSSSSSSKTLTMDEVREMRVRDIKWRLSRNHGYSAEELGRILDKAELIEALSFEEHKERQKYQQQMKRAVLIRGVIFTIIAIFVVAGWPVWTHLYAVASVNLVVYWDKKKYETSRCIELRSFKGMIGVLLMAIVDLMAIWLTLSVLGSWVTTSEYFFPVPNLSVRPAAMMGGEVAQGPLAKYGLNLGPMAVSWAIRFVHGQLEILTGKALSAAYQHRKREARQGESPEERAARKAARRAAKKAAKEEAEQRKYQEGYSEAQRRKEAADQATQDLFGPRTERNPPPPPQDKEFHEQTLNNMADTADDDKEFREQMDNMDMDDLD